MYPLRKGKTASQAHVGLPEGTFEEEHGRRGFYGKSAHLYHGYLPTGWIRFEGKLRPHCFDLNQLKPSNLADPEGLPMPFYFRNADGDELYFVHRGRGKIETDFGPLDTKACWASTPCMTRPQSSRPSPRSCSMIATNGRFALRSTTRSPKSSTRSIPSMSWAGMATLHPRSIHHGPHPKALANQKKKTHTDESAVMLDGLNPIHVLPAGEGVEWKDYWSWMGKKPVETR